MNKKESYQEFKSRYYEYFIELYEMCENYGVVATRLMTQQNKILMRQFFKESKKFRESRLERKKLSKILNLAESKELFYMKERLENNNIEVAESSESF